MYQTAAAAYFSFCVRFNLTALPASEENLLLFLAELSQTKAPSTVHTYLAGIRHMHIISGYPNPLESAPRLQLALRGFKRYKPPQANPRLPITPHVLRAIKSVLLQTPQEYNNVMLWATVCVGFFGFLRSGEFVVKSASAFDPASHLMPSDVAVDSYTDPSMIRLLIKRSKTDQFGNGASIFLARTYTDLCPVAALLAYLARRPVHGHSPLFITEDGTPFTKMHLIKLLHATLREAGINPEFYKGHSFRIGAATTAAALGLQDSTIQKMGRWSSSAFLAYIRTPQQDLAAVSKLLGRA